MSEYASSFIALGAGNGFPFCPPKVDVSGADLWTTLSGHKKGDGAPTSESIFLSLSHAMHLFWNTKGISADATATRDDTTISLNEIFSTTGEPFTRVCAGNVNLFNDNKTGSLLDHRVILNSGGLRISRMYDGNTENEANFVGYGIANQFGQFEPQSSNGHIEVQARVPEFLGQLWMANALNVFPQISGFTRETDYTQVGEMHFVCAVTSLGVNGEPESNPLTVNVSAETRLFMCSRDENESLSQVGFSFFGQFNNFIFFEYL